MNLITLNRFSKLFCLPIIFIWLFPLLATAQQHEIRDIIASIDSSRKNLPIEKLYLQLDKPYYAKGDTIWFKAYLFNADFLGAATQNGLFYIELANDSNQVIRRLVFPLNQGISDI